jgi:hypothetical protein
MKCPYNAIFGTPGQGPHSHRIFGYALVDILATILIALITARFTEYSFLMAFTMWFILGELLHYAFGVQTEVLTTLGIKACPDEKNEIIEPTYSIGY